MLRSAPQQTVMHDEKNHLNGDHNWQNLWETLTGFAERFEMDSVELMVHLPKIGEEYHASWKRKTNTASHQEWKSEIPLIVEGMRVGYMRVVGAVGDGSICKWMSDLIGGLEAFESELVTLIEDLRDQHAIKDATKAAKATNADTVDTQSVSDVTDVSPSAHQSSAVTGAHSH